MGLFLSLMVGLIIMGAAGYMIVWAIQDWKNDKTVQAFAIASAAALMVTIYSVVVLIDFGLALGGIGGGLAVYMVYWYVQKQEKKKMAREQSGEKN